MPSLYAGRNQIAHSTAAGERKADGGQARNPGRSKIYILRFRSIRSSDDPDRDFDSTETHGSGNSRQASHSGYGGG